MDRGTAQRPGSVADLLAGLLDVLDAALTVGCGTGAVRLLRLQRAGRAAQDVDEFLRGMPLPRGTQLG